MKDDVGVGDAAIVGNRGRRPRQLAAEAAEQRAAGVVLGQPFRGATPAVAVAGAAVLQMEGVQHAVADEPVCARGVELRVGAIAIERTVELARQFAGHLEMRRVAFHRDRGQIGPGHLGLHLVKHLRFPPVTSLHRKDTSKDVRAGRQAKSLQCKNCGIRSSMARTSRETGTNRPAAARRRPAKPVAERPAPRRRRPAGETPYHHGDLHDALLAAAERVLERDGLAGLTLRAVSREAGVSHAAPTHHFGDLTGLLSELAAIGFRRFNDAMVAARNSETHPLLKGLANAKAYVAYAQASPGMFSLMFRTERLDMSRPSLHEAATQSFEGLVSAVGAGRNEKLTGETLTLDQAAAIA